MFSTTLSCYRLAEIPVGATYATGVSAKRYSFGQSSRIVEVIDELQDLDFTAQETQLLTVGKIPRQIYSTNA